MPFNKRWEDGEYIVDRTQTGPPPTPETGTIVEQDGSVVADSATVSIAPATPVKVTIPGPREAVIDARGCMTPRWRRFFEELYRRTGAIEDNINRSSRALVGSGTTASLSISSSAPTVGIDHVMTPSIGSLTLTGAAPTVS